jgi:general secretion pathway protein A
MDPSVFGLSGNPFAKPESAQAPCGSEDQAALTTELHAGLKAPHGITLLIGESGAGKTTFIRNFLAQLPETFVVAYLPTAGPGLRHLLTETIEQLGGTVAAGAQEQGLIDSLRALARARAEHERSTLIVIDDAHDLPAKTIERLGKLFGSDPAEPSRLHLTLVGRTELLDRMNAANDRSILKHLVQVCRMDPMGPEDSFRYIADRVQRVGGIVDRLFTQDALRLVVERANGNPGRIDALCSGAMERAAADGKSAVDAESVEAAGEGTAEDLLDGEIVTTKDEPNTPTYFFNDDDDSEPSAQRPGSGAVRIDPVPPATAGAPMKAPSTSRRRLAFWALGGTAVLIAFAAMMSDRITSSEVVGQGAPKQLAAQNGEKPQAVAKTAADKPKKKAEVSEEGVNAPVPEPLPKLVAKRGDAATVSGVSEANPESVAAQVAAGAPDRPRFPAPPLNETAPPSGASPAAASTASGSAEAEFPVTVPGPPTVAAEPGPAAAAPSLPPPSAPARAAAPKPTPAVAQAEAPRPPQASPGAAAAPAKPAPASEAPIPPTRPAAAPAPRVIAPPSQAATAAAAPGVRYTVQIGAFSSRGNAEAFLAKARGVAKDGRIVASTSAGKPIFRVVAGSFASSAEANTHASSLRENGYPTFVRTLD